MLSLITGDVAQSEPNLRVRWCVDKEDLLVLKEEETDYIHVFLVVVYENGIEDRFLVPMDELMTYLPLRFPGDHLILAAIVWKRSASTSNDWSKGEDKLFKKFNRNEYSYSILNRRRDGIESDDLARVLNEHGTIFNLTAALRVNVPQRFFPKEPPAWMKRVANLGHEYDAIDQCQFRRRAACAPFFLTSFLVMRSVFGLLAMLLYLGLGFRGVNPSVLWHPWQTSLAELHTQRRWGSFWERNNSWFFEYADGRKKSKVWWLLNPLVLGFVWLWLEIASRWTGVTYLGLVRYIFAILQAVPSILWFLVALVMGLATGVLLVARFINNYRDSKQQQMMLPEARERKRQEQERAEQLALEEQIRVLSCEYVPKRQPSVADIPPRYRTVRLRFLEIKALVCRPFAGH